MFTWLADHSGTILFLLVLIAAGWAAAWWLYRERKYLIGLAVATGLALLVWLLSVVVATDRKLLTNDLHAMAEAFGLGKKEELTRRIAPDMEYRGLKRDDLLDQGLQLARKGAVTEVRIWGVDVEHVNRAEGRAQVWFGATVHGGSGELLMARFRGFFVLRGERWQLKEIKRYNLVANQDREIDLLRP